MWKYLSASLTALVLTLPSAAAESSDDRVAQLEQALAARDAVINELLERVDALERRAGLDAARPSPRPPPVADVGREGEAGADGDAPGRVVVEEGAAQRALERSLTLQGALLLPSGLLEFEPAFVYARREDRVPTLVSSADEVLIGEAERDVDDLTLGMALRLGLPWDSQLEVDVPYRWRRVESVTRVGLTPADATHRSDSGWGDLRVGLAKTLLREGRWRPDLVGRLTWDSDSGHRSNGALLGDGFQQLQGSLTAIKTLDPVAFVGGLSYRYAFEQDRLQPGATIGASLGAFVALSPETSLQISVAGAYQDEARLSGDRIDGSDRTLASLILGGSTLIAPATLVNFSTAIGLTNDADDLRFTFSIPVRSRSRLF
jgi:hypothetical protein